MQELDEVFSRSNNVDVSQQLRDMRDKIDLEIVKLQNEVQVLKGLQELSQDLVCAVRQGTLMQPKKGRKHKGFTDMSDLAGAMDRI